MDAEDLDFREASFDAVLCGFGLMFFPHLAQTLDGFRKVLKPGGRLAVSTWATPDPRYTWELDLWHAYGIWDQHVSHQMAQELQDAEELVQVLEVAGFAGVTARRESDHLVHRDAAQWWERSLSNVHTRVALDSLDAAARARFQAEAFERLAQLAGPDGIPQRIEANLAVARVR
jgi:SAM-dependent methyltransferase